MAKTASAPTSAATATKRPPKVKACDCRHEYQDKTYGAGKRLMNPSVKGYRCTVCDKIHGDV